MNSNERSKKAGSRWPMAAVAAITGCVLALALGGCSAIDPAAVKAREGSGSTRRYDRPSADLYSASVAAIDIVRAESNYWNQLKIVDREPAQGTVIAEQSLDSAVLPGVGTRDAIGIFVKDVPPDASDVTVVVMGSDQLPGSTGTSAASWTTASSVVFPAIDKALESIPVTPRAAAAPAPAPRPAAAPAAASRRTVPASATGVSTASPATTSRGAAGEPARTLDAVYDTLQASGSWRPLVRETRVDGSEEVRVGGWATLGATSDGRVLLKVRAGASAGDAARLALALSQAGFSVEVESEVAPGRKR